MAGKEYSAAEAAELLGITKIAVNKLIQRGRLNAKKEGNMYKVSAWAIASYELVRKPAGRPRKGSSPRVNPLLNLVPNP